MGETLLGRVSRGCPQLLNKLLCLLDQNGHKVLNQADDLVILVQGKYNNVVRGRNGRILQVLNFITKWKWMRRDATVEGG